MPTLDVGITQINCKRHWPLRVRRMRKMLREAERAGATILTLNEIDKKMALAIKDLPGWDIHWEINDELGNGNWAGNAVAWVTSHWDLDHFGTAAVEIKYRTGKKFGGAKGRWATKTINQAHVTLLSTHVFGFRLAVQAYHYPTRFNSNDDSRDASVERSERWVMRRIKRDIATIIAGDGNGLRPQAKGLRKMEKDGPDNVDSTGKLIRSKVLGFKRALLSDHNGIFVLIRFRTEEDDD